MKLKLKEREEFMKIIFHGFFMKLVLRASGRINLNIQKCKHRFYSTNQITLNNINSFEYH